MQRVTFGHCQRRLTLPCCPFVGPPFISCHFCSDDASANSSGDNTIKRPHQAARRIAEKAAVAARTEQFYRYVQQGIGALQAHQRAESDFKGLLDQFTRMASDQTAPKTDGGRSLKTPPPFAAGEKWERLEELAEQCKMSISMAIKKDFVDSYSAESEQFQRHFVERRTRQQQTDAANKTKTGGRSAPYRAMFAASSPPPDGFRPLFAEEQRDALKERPLRFWRDWDERRSRIMGQGLGPKNAWEEQIQWTERGMMWPYPIDNDYMAGEEEKYSFVDHVFLETELAKYKLPRSGPVAHFMELVVNGLSRNPYMSVKKKHEHLEWYAGYFNDALKGKYKALFD
ncbi:hypothetical protein niasHT_007516 [Heterodera trifolii]|uniref:Small ribosomal subunit protein mS31 n=1 Tax=Heterodera trifolii TaxID=157864 RepID=A0ABD2LPD3_9BILA